MPNPRAPKTDPSTITLRELIEDRLILVFECRRCGKLSEVDVLQLVHLFGPDTLASATLFRGRCSRCGRRSARALLRDPTRRKEEGWLTQKPMLSR